MGRSRSRSRSRGRRNRERISLLVRNLPHDASSNEIRYKFEKYGPVRDVYLPRDFRKFVHQLHIYKAQGQSTQLAQYFDLIKEYTEDTGRPRGFGFIEMMDERDAEDAIYYLDRTKLGGREITVCRSREGRKDPRDMASRDRPRGDGGSRGRRGRSRSPRREKDDRSRSRSKETTRRRRSPSHSRSRSRGSLERGQDRDDDRRSRSRSRSKSPAAERKQRSQSPMDHHRDRSRSRTPPVGMEEGGSPDAAHEGGSPSREGDE